MTLSLLISFSTMGLILLCLWVFFGSFGLAGSSIAIISLSSTVKSLPVLIIIIFSCFIAVSLGDIFAYELARKLSNPLAEKLRFFAFFKNRELKANELLRKYESLIVFISRFALGSLCPVITYLSGLQKLNRKKFITAVLAGELIFSILFVSIGYLFGEVFNSIISAYSYFLLAIFLLILAFYFIKKAIKKYRKSRLIII